MSDTNSLSVLTPMLNSIGQQRLFEFLDFVDTATAARFRTWLSTAGETEVRAAADLLNGLLHGRDFAGWWRTQDKTPAGQAAPPEKVRRSRSTIERLHSDARARQASRDLTYGGLWLLGGIAVTGISFSIAASSAHGGTYVIASGAMLFGAIRLLRGLMAK